MGFTIVSDGGCDLPLDYIKQHDIGMVSCYVSLDGEHYQKNYVDLTIDEFYDAIITKRSIPRTTLPSIQDYYEVFEREIREGRSVLCVCMSSELSGSYQSAMNAKRMIEEEYREAILMVVDSRVDTVLQGLLIQECVRMRADKMPIQNVFKAMEEIKYTGKIYFSIDSMEYLIKGGRINNLVHIINSKLGIKPVLALRNGEHHLIGITRCHRRSMEMLIEQICKAFCSTGEDPNNYLWIVGSGVNRESALQLKKAIEEKLNISISTDIQTIGAVIASHTGPYPVGVAWLKKYNEKQDNS